MILIAGYTANSKTIFVIIGLSILSPFKKSAEISKIIFIFTQFAIGLKMTIKKKNYLIYA